MKRILFCLILTAVCSLHSQSWQTFTNTNHVYDLIASGNTVTFSTWGGVVEISGSESTPFSQMTQTRTWTTGDGLASNDIRTLAKIDFSASLWFGSSDYGVNIFSPNGLQNLDTSLGLPSSRVNKIIEHESNILVATSHGLAVFYYLPSVSFPLMLHQYNSINTYGGLSDNNISDMLLTENKYLYMANSSSINYVHLDSLEINDAWHNLIVGSPIPMGSSFILSANNSKLAVATQGKVFIRDINLETNEWTIYSQANGLTGSTISAMHLSSDNYLRVAYGTWNENLMIYNRTIDTVMTEIDPANHATQILANTAGLGYKSIAKIVEYAGRIYLCSWGEGIYRLYGSVWENFFPESLGFPKITVSKTDNNYTRWFVSGNIGDQLTRKGTMGVSSDNNGDWSSFNRKNSRLHSDNILALEVDSRNRKWFGSWDTNTQLTGWLNGVTVYDETDQSWKRYSTAGIHSWNEDTNQWNTDPYSTAVRLTSATIGAIYRDGFDNMLVLGYDRGVTVIDANDQFVTDFKVPNTNFQRVISAYHNGRQYFIGTENDNGLSIWNHNSIPVTGGEHWITQIPTSLRSGSIYGVVSVKTPYEGWQHWIAAGNGLYMWNETSWYRYDTYIKRYRYNFSSSEWVNDTLYYADEERLFGSINTTPTCIFADPFGRVWVGSLDKGISMYDPAKERFTNYFKGNAPILSNRIVSLSYDPLKGDLLIGTTDGLNTLKIGRIVKPIAVLDNMKAFPNPFKADGRSTVQIVNLPIDSLPAGDLQCSIYSASGTLIIKLSENPFSRFEWDGKNSAGNLVSSGVYYFVVSDASGNFRRGKIAVFK